MSIQRKIPLKLCGGLALAGLGTPDFWPVPADAIKVSYSKTSSAAAAGPSGAGDSPVDSGKTSVNLLDCNKLTTILDGVDGEKVTYEKLTQHQCLQKRECSFTGIPKDKLWNPDGDSLSLYDFLTEESRAGKLGYATCDFSVYTMMPKDERFKFFDLIHLLLSRQWWVDMMRRDLRAFADKYELDLRMPLNKQIGKLGSDEEGSGFRVLQALRGVVETIAKEQSEILAIVDEFGRHLLQHKDQSREFECCSAFQKFFRADPATESIMMWIQGGSIPQFNGCFPTVHTDYARHEVGVTVWFGIRLETMGAMTQDDLRDGRIYFKKLEDFQSKNPDEDLIGLLRDIIANKGTINLPWPKTTLNVDWSHSPAMINFLAEVVGDLTEEYRMKYTLGFVNCSIRNLEDKMETLPFVYGELGEGELQFQALTRHKFLRALAFLPTTAHAGLPLEYEDMVKQELSERATTDTRYKFNIPK